MIPQIVWFSALTIFCMCFVVAYPLAAGRTRWMP